MKKIVIFGAGKSSTVLIEYLKTLLLANNWHLLVADFQLEPAIGKTKNAPNTVAVAADVTDYQQRTDIIKEADIVISLLPPTLHLLIAKSCIECKKNLLTASYLSEDIKVLEEEISREGLLFLCEMGLDPGIDHMSAMQIIDDIHQGGGKINSFYSHCGGLVAPESDDNPWRYKISWNPRNVVMAGKSGAAYLKEGSVTRESYEELFNASRVVSISDVGSLAWYPNRDSISYIALYGLKDIRTFIRTTLRFPEFCFGWKNLIDLKLTDEALSYQTNDMSLQQFFQQHLHENGFTEWINNNFTARFKNTRELLDKLAALIEAEKMADPAAKASLDDMMMVDNSGDLKKVTLEGIKEKAVETVAGQMHEANLFIEQLAFLGMDDKDTMINLGDCSAADVLQFIMEHKLRLKETDRDMIVMLHQIEFEQDGKQFAVESSMVIKGEDNRHTAMARTVGMPLGIAARLILEGKLNVKGLHIPIIPEIYQPVMKELEKEGIRFEEVIRPL